MRLDRGSDDRSGQHTLAERLQAVYHGRMLDDFDPLSIHDGTLRAIVLFLMTEVERLSAENRGLKEDVQRLREEVGRGEEGRVIMAASAEPTRVGGPIDHGVLQYWRIVDAAQEGIWQLDAAERITFVNQKFADLLGYTIDEMLGQSAHTFMHQTEVDRTRVNWAARRSRDRKSTQRDMCLQHKDGTAVWVLASTTNLEDEHGQFAGILAMLTDITQRKRVEQALGEMATTDNLTGLANRTLLSDRLEQALQIAQRQRTGVALLVLDLNNFKEVNDTHGHAVGDRLLQEMARRVAATIRASDTAARLGGDEFGLQNAGSRTPGGEHGAK
jgi:PAS domain S-box-containing protein